MTEEEIIHKIEAESRRRTEAVRQMLLDQGRPDLVAELDANLRKEAMGVTRAENIWHSISPAQRRVILLLAKEGGRLKRRHSAQVFDLYVEQRMTKWGVAGIKTIRNLASRNLLDWDGGAFDPEAAAILSDHGRFVHRMGPPAIDGTG